jgi:hypothetical protein
MESNKHSLTSRSTPGMPKLGVTKMNDTTTNITAKREKKVFPVEAIVGVLRC